MQVTMAIGFITLFSQSKVIGYNYSLDELDDAYILRKVIYMHYSIICPTFIITPLKYTFTSSLPQSNTVANRFPTDTYLCKLMKMP